MPRIPVVSFTLLSLTAAGCNYETKDPNSDECTEIAGVEEDCMFETGGSDTGGSDETGGDGPVEFASGQCRHNFNEDNPDDYGWRFQCEGHMFASIDFDAPLDNDCETVLGDRCHEHHIFGPSNDTYESPDVMACCGPYDPAHKASYLEYCGYDILQQVCISMAKRIEKLVEDGSFGVYAGQGAKLQQWVAINYSTCFNELLDNNTSLDTSKIISSWSIPNSPDWPALENFVITIDDGTRVTGVMQPADPADWLSCNSTLDNNDEVFEDSTPPGGGVVHGINLDADLRGALIGPSLFGGPITATVTFPVTCAIKGCSNAVLWQDASATELVVHDLNLFTDSFTIDNGAGMSMSVDSARVALYEHANTNPIYDNRGNITAFEVAPRDAFFLLTGTAGEIHDLYLAHNATPITITQSEGSWQLAPFEIEYTDESSQTWSAALDESQWR